MFYFKFFGKHITRPCRDLLEKAIGRAVSRSTGSNFLTQAEAQSAMTIAPQNDLFSLHAISAKIDGRRGDRPGGRGICSNHGHGCGKAFGRGQVQHLLSSQLSAQLPAPQRQQHHQQQP